MPMQQRWDIETDLVIAGFGFAGGASAVYAYDAGIKDILILEKTQYPGGLSITSGGGIVAGCEREQAFECVKAACAGRTPDDVVRAFSDGLCDLQGWLEELVAAVGLTLEIE